MFEFEDDEAGYLAWTESNPEGYVLNLRRGDRPDPNYVVLHRANCRSISSRKHRIGAYTARSFRKICSADLNELELAASGEGRPDGSFSKICSLCHPTR